MPKNWIIGILSEAKRPGAEIRILVRRHNVTEQTFYRWHGRLRCPQPKVLESKNAKLKNLVAEQLLAIDALKEFLGGGITSSLARRRLMALTSQRGLSKRSACRILGFSRRVACCRLRRPEKDRAITEQLVSKPQHYPCFRTQGVTMMLSRLMRLYEKPQHIRSDNGAGFAAGAVIRWLRDQNLGPALIASGSPWQNGYVESFNGMLRDECLSRAWIRLQNPTAGR